MKTVKELGKRAKEASYDLGLCQHQKNKALELMALALLKNKEEIIKETKRILKEQRKRVRQLRLLIGYT